MDREKLYEEVINKLNDLISENEDNIELWQRLSGIFDSVCLLKVTDAKC